MAEFLAGLITMGFVVASVFFLRFWARTGDRLFAAFAIAFALFGLEQALLVMSAAAREEQSWFFLLRLAGFALILAGIIRKNAGFRQ